MPANGVVLITAKNLLTPSANGSILFVSPGSGGRGEEDMSTYTITFTIKGERLGFGEHTRSYKAASGTAAIEKLNRDHRIVVPRAPGERFHILACDKA